MTWNPAPSEGRIVLAFSPVFALAVGMACGTQAGRGGGPPVLGVYKNVDDIKSNTVADFDHKLKERLMSIGLATGVDYADPKTGEVELLDYFEDGHIITVGARGVVLRDTKKDIGKRGSGDSFGQDRQNGIGTSLPPPPC